jgi:hypothetical protein
MALMSAASSAAGSDANSQVEVRFGLHNGKTSIEIENPKPK